MYSRPIGLFTRAYPSFVTKSAPLALGWDASPSQGYRPLALDLWVPHCSKLIAIFLTFVHSIYLPLAIIWLKRRVGRQCSAKELHLKKPGQDDGY